LINSILYLEFEEINAQPQVPIVPIGAKSDGLTGRQGTLIFVNSAASPRAHEYCYANDSDGPEGGAASVILVGARLKLPAKGGSG
jgi:hypothetical protein